MMEEPDEVYGKPKTFEEAVKLMDIWKNKYLELMEKYNRLIEEKMKSK